MRKKIFAGILLTCALMLNSCEKTDDPVSTVDRDKFIGIYNPCESSGPGGVRNFSMDVTASVSAPDQIKLRSFDGGNNTIIFATVSGNSLAINNQTAGNETYNGSGSLSSNGKKLTINFTVDDGQGTESRIMTGDKQ